ncbi:hypothetical protein M9458_050974 [Cirrhinus mrigala]|uniref:Gypsy retrotransposon integrase-like protein 1 n=1 Tax=Cirrhinus mrigala TaxID=683832 RepID=A0ABD0MYS2_CIRMR
MAAIGMDTKPEARKVALLLTIAGPQAIEVYNTFVFNENEDRNKLDDVLAKFTAHCSHKKNESNERCVFRSRVQQPQETFDNFLTDLRLKAKTCNFDQLSDSMIRDQIVFGIGDAKLRQRLLRETELSLQEAIKICQASELAQLHVKTFGEVMPKSMSSNTDAAIGAVSFKEKRRTFRAAKQKDGVYSSKRCGTDHQPKQCPAFGKHVLPKKRMKQKGRSVKMIEETDLSDTFFVGMVTCENLQESENTGCEQLSVNAQCQEDAVKNDKWVAPLQINGALVTLKLDTGAKANLISMSDIKNMTEKPKIKKKPILLKDYNGKSIDSLGICRLKVTIKDKVHHLLFSVVAEELESLLGDKACENLNLVKRVYHINHDNSAVTTSNSVDDIVRSFVDVLKRLWCFTLRLQDPAERNAQPVVHPARRVPAPLKDRLKKELVRMTTLGVIKRIQEPTDWVNSMVCVKKKNGDLRVCMDPKDLNHNIKREHYQIPKREEIMNEMAGAKYFTKLDASQGFWQIRLDEDSTKYCTFNTPFEHNSRLTKVLQKIRVSGLKLNKDKCQFGVQELLFLGDKLSSQGIQPDSEKINAILKMKCPTERKGVQRIIGMFFDPTKKTKVSTDASKNGLGAVLLQADDEIWKPVAYASRSMTDSECRYAQIEKECLGLVFGLEKFHNYVYGLPTFTAETDHRPLIAIIKKNLNEMTPRIQRLMMKLLRYDFNLVYTPGKYLVLADTLSRAPTQNSESTTEEDVEIHVNLVRTAFPLSDAKSKQIAEETRKDDELQAVIDNMYNGWLTSSSPKFHDIRGHLGIEKCKRRARETVFWHGINKDIEKMVRQCDTCRKYRNNQTKEPMIIPDLPTSPWEKVGMDLFYLKGNNYLVVIDYYSNYPELALLSNMSSKCVITHAKSIFARHGIPQTVVSDNGSCFSSKEWQDFSVLYDFKHVTSSPEYAQSNDKAEKGVHILKQLLKKAADSKSDPYLALLNYRTSPLECGMAPVEMLMSRKLRTTLPSCAKRRGNVKMKQKLKQLKDRQKFYYDRATKHLQPLARNDVVLIKDDENWSKKATVMQEVAPRSYTVKTNDGQIFRRNRRDLLRTEKEREDLNQCNARSESTALSTKNDCNTDSNNETQIPDNQTFTLRRSTRHIKKPDKLNL